MFETNLVVVGNVLTAPEWRRTTTQNQLVTNFRIASTARRYDRETGRWVDGDSLRVRVTAWRRLAEGVASSITVGDPVVVYGRIYTRDWVDDDNKHRIAYEMEAFAIGHDLARGRSRFYRTKALPNSVIEDAETDAFVRGELTEPLGDEENPIEFGEGLPDEQEPAFLEVVAGTTDDTTEAGEEEPAEETRRVRRTTRREPVAA
ncbi:single-stranded DNA-binding protein [Actinoplanes utahensis]|uniref:Single-stranded DNA-binding protein n=1 Tax=Actinoplanes utahensis TaxID=1869 RepID=A0A0A6UJD6_ACTUT|nr:single-stranded DNA-binding protein [Actinoplanes utahensis]KHD75188.1 single-stranded DNA-binding protein [Actinoplanes utahensis]GIF28353.1 hypothetical protein Aut01nite_13390 [Actinoplanes utahensis]